MKKHSLPHSAGVALLLVLGSLVLISVLAVAFLSSVSTDLRSSKLYAEGASAQLLSGVPVNTIIGQIQAATKGSDSSGMLAWASQPGMIRTYDDSGRAAGYYKLYSSATMVGSGPFNPSADAEMVPGTWDSDKGLYVDLNEPIVIGSGADTQTCYPIVNPAAASPHNTSYDPILGFSITASDRAVFGKQNLAPMPVLWLYMLQDGTLAAPTGAGNKAIVMGATANNPIVGRVAFWTDDESCKININTASNGIYWDTPRVCSDYDRNNLAQMQPARNEFQRYPGHPATTSLHPVFSYTGTTGVVPPHLTSPSGGSLFQGSAQYSEYIPYYTLTPRIADGGSKGGTVVPTGPLTLDRDRLYANIDELQFRPDRKLLTDPSVNIRMDGKFIDQTRFFITANSRSPDVNLFNRPRITAWPIHSTDDNAHRSVLDQMIAFCSTIGSRPFYFVRSNPNSPTADLGLGRNQTLLTYLRTLTSNDVPGFGGNFAAKYPLDRDQILTEIFDYIRCTNLMDPSVTNPFTATTSSPGKGQVIPIVEAGTRGFGRFPTVSKAFFQFIGIATSSTAGTVPPVPAGKIRVQAIFVPNLFDPSLGWGPNHPNFKIRISGLDQFTWDGAASMNFPRSATIAVTRPNTVAHGLNIGGPQGFQHLLTGRTLGTGTDDTHYPFFSSTMDLSSAALSSFGFSGASGNVKIEFLTNDTAETVIQTINLNFPNGPFPVPTLAPAASRSFNLRFASLDAIPPILSTDVVRSVESGSGDIRLIAGRETVLTTDNLFSKHPSYNDTSKPMAHNLYTADSYPYVGATCDGTNRGKLVAGMNYYSQSSATTTNGSSYQRGIYDSEVSTKDGVVVGGTGSVPGDWDNGVGNIKDGAYINKPDEGSTFGAGTSSAPYFDNLSSYTFSADTYFSPARQMPSAAMFGSLPTGVKANRPWQTLLFRSLPEGHPGLGTPAAGPPYTVPPDHLLLDLFTMPVVEPYPISEPFSTAGRINLNHQIVPFTYLKRTTGIHALIGGERTLAISDGQASTYKRGNYPATQPTTGSDYRKNLSVNGIISGIQRRFDNNDLFRSASEICSVHMVPAGATYDTTADYWKPNPIPANGHAINGDNSRERPYVNLYPRVTTKSNSFTVHYRVQTLQKSKARMVAATQEFDTTRGDIVTGEYRGSALIERYIDPNEPDLPDFASASLTDSAASIDRFYRYRIIQSKKFAP